MPVHAATLQSTKQAVIDVIKRIITPPGNLSRQTGQGRQWDKSSETSTIKTGSSEAVVPQFSRATRGARNSRSTGDHLACPAPLEEWPRSLSPEGHHGA
jgi:hypothetical protein